MLACVFSVVVVIFVLVFSRESLTTVGGRFMDALMRHDTVALTKMSMMKGLTDEQIQKEWDESVNVAAKYYMFAYHIDGASQSGDTLGSIRMKVIKDIDHPGSYDENFELPMVKVGDAWKVDVRSISHEMFPGLPR
ncbi:MAG: hypothetical protein P4L46_12125 [Fimbriimonas sp.]|nr:hypothetical protein [Fimbriimonas sp.]